MPCLRFWLQCVSRLRSFHCTRSVQKGRGISLSRRDLSVVSALVLIRKIQVRTDLVHSVQCDISHVYRFAPPSRERIADLRAFIKTER